MPQIPFTSTDPRQLPLYSVTEAARFIGLPRRTVRDWVHGRRQTSGTHSDPIIRIPNFQDGRLSFNNLVEVHVLSALRQKHRVPMVAIREGIRYAEREMQIAHPLLRDELRAGLGEMFFDTIFGYVNLSRSGQYAIRKIVEIYLERVERDMSQLPMRLYPMIAAAPGSTSVVIDPRVSFGQPVVAKASVPTAIIVQLYNANASVEEVAEEYGLTVKDVSDVLLYEQGKAA